MYLKRAARDRMVPLPFQEIRVACKPSVPISAVFVPACQGYVGGQDRRRDALEEALVESRSSRAERPVPEQPPESPH